MARDGYYRRRAVGALLIALIGQAQADQRCEPAAGRLISAEGQVETRSATALQWQAITQGALFCPGDVLRIGQKARAAVRLQDHTLLRLDADTTLTFTGQDTEKNTLLELAQGVVYFISRITRKLTIQTPFVNAGVEGTEFLLRVDSSEASIHVIEGRVRAANAQGSQLVTSGAQARAVRGGAPALETAVRPGDAAQWTLYYPPLLYIKSDTFDALSATWRDAVIRSAAAYHHGDLASAQSALDDVPGDIDDIPVLLYRASLNLAVGQVTAANLDVTRALKTQPDNGQALALNSIITLVQNDLDTADNLARSAVANMPQAVAPQLALSYVQQARFELDAARATLERAVQQIADDALLWARLAELRLMFRDLTGARDAAERAVALAPTLSHGHSVLGYAHLLQIDIDAAKINFARAIELDQGAPLPRLGLGLAKIRGGDLREGREEIETAVLLDPNRSLTRSYLGKTYYEEQRPLLAADQYTLAKELDPLDPTPWLYDAILKQSTNRPVDALQDVQQSIALNDNRAVYRSRLLLDEDAAARGASLARTYADLGFQQLAAVEAWKSLSADPANYSAHRFLADAYTTLPRHETTRVSEVLQAQLLQPVTARPINPSAAETSLFILEGSGPNRAAFNEFTPLYARDRVALQANLTGGTDDTFSDEAVLFGNYHNVAASLGQLHYSTNGHRPNSDFDQNLYDAFLQYDVNDATSMQIEWRRRDIEGGDVAQRFGADNYDALLRQTYDQESARLGFRHAFTPRHRLLGSIIYDRQERHDVSAPFDFTSVTEGYNAELQDMMQLKTAMLTLGAGHSDQRGHTQFLFDFEDSIFPVEDSRGTREDDNVYAYGAFTSHPQLHITLGMSHDRVDIDKTNLATGLPETNSHKQFNPKLGVLWTPTQQTTARLAAFRTLRRLTHANKTIEPTQIAGFNQLFDDVVGTDAKRYGLGLDHQFSSNLFAGIELTHRDSDKPNYSPSGITQEDNHEILHRAYIYRILNPNWNVATDYFFMRHTREFPVGSADSQNPVELTTQYLPLKLNYHHPRGFFGKVTANLVSQRVGFSTEQGVADDQSRFITVDLMAGYRLANHKTMISVTAQNIFDRQFNFHDTSLSTETPTPLLARFRPERNVFASLVFWF